MRNLTREKLFERWLHEVVEQAGPYDEHDHETFSKFSERVTDSVGRLDTPGAEPSSAGDQGRATEPA